MESSLVVNKNKGRRRTLGQRPTKVIQNKIDKLVLYDSKYYFKSFNFKHVESLLNLDFFKLSPSDFLKIFSVFNRNLYYNENLYYSLYKSLLDRIVYFSFDQLLSLIEFISPFTVVKHNNTFSSYFLDSDVLKESVPSSDNSSENSSCDSELVPLSDKTIDIYQVQNEVLSKIIDVLENKLKFSSIDKDDESFDTNPRCLNILNKFAFLNRWDILLTLSNNISRSLIDRIIKYGLIDSDRSYNLDKLNNLDKLGQLDKVSGCDKSSDLEKILDCVNYVSDTLSLKSIDLMCKNIELNKFKIESNNVVDFINLSLFEYRDILLSYYSRGDIQIMNLIVNYYDGLKLSPFETLSSKLVSELHLLCNISKNLYQIFVFLKDNMVDFDIMNGNLDLYLNFNFKLLSCLKFLIYIDSSIFNNKFELENVYREMCRIIPGIFIEHKSSLTPKSQSILLSIICESLNKEYDTYDMEEENVEENSSVKYNIDDMKKLLRIIHECVSNSLDLSSIDRLSVLESSYNSFHYINHYSTKRMLDYTISQFPKNPVDALISLRFLIFSFKLPFNLISTETKSIKKSLDFISNSVPDLLKSDFKQMELHLNRSYLKSTKNKYMCQYDNIPWNKWKFRVNNVNINSINVNSVNKNINININRHIKYTINTNVLRCFNTLKSIRF